MVRIRNAEGKYLSNGADTDGFSDDINRAMVFDFVRDRVAEQLELVRIAHGVNLETVPVDPSEFYERCDSCKQLSLAFNTWFDGQRFLCRECQGVIRQDSAARTK